MSKQKNEMVLLQGMPFAQSKKSNEPSVLTLRQAVTAIFRSKWLLIATTSIGVVGGAWMALGKPNDYLSTGKFLIRSGGEQIVINPGANPGSDVPQRQPLLGNAAAILQSEEVLRRTIRRLGPSYILAAYQPRLDPAEQAAGGLGTRVRGVIYALQRRLHRPSATVYKESDALLALQRRLSIVQQPNTQVLGATLQANDPVRAQRTLEVFMEEAQERHLEVYSATRSIKEVEAGYRESRDENQKAQLALKDFNERHGLQEFQADYAVALDDARNALAELRTLDTSIQTNRTTLAGLQTRLGTVQRMIPVTEIVVIPNQTVQAIQNQITEHSGRLRELSARGLRDNDPAIINLRRAIAEAKRDLTEELKKPPKTTEVTNVKQNPEWLATTQSITETQLALVVAEERRPGVLARVKKTKALSDQLTKLRPAWTSLSRDVDRTTAKLDQAEDLLSRARRKSALEEKRFSALRILDRPNLPLVKEGPKRARIVLGGLLGGLFLGIGIVLMRALTDSTVRSAEDLESLGTLKVLATMPNLDKTSVRRHESMRVTSWS